MGVLLLLEKDLHDDLLSLVSEDGAEVLVGFSMREGKYSLLVNMWNDLANHFIMFMCNGIVALFSSAWRMYS